MSRLALVLALAALGVLALAPASAHAGQAGQKTPAKPAAQVRKPLPSRPLVLPASRRPGRPGSFEVSVAGAWLGPASAGTSAATLTPNGQGTDRFTWFNAKAEYQSSPGVRAAIAYNLTRTFAVEGAFGYSPSTIRFVISEDTELSDGFTSPGQRLSEYSFEAALVAHLGPLTFAGGRGRPFVSGGAGYLRQLPSGNAAVETGQIYHVGGGVKYLLSSRRKGMIRAFGLRGDARLNIRSGAFSFTSDRVLSPAASVGLVVAF